VISLGRKPRTPSASIRGYWRQPRPPHIRRERRPRRPVRAHPSPGGSAHPYVNGWLNHGSDRAPGRDREDTPSCPDGLVAATA